MFNMQKFLYIILALVVSATSQNSYAVGADKLAVYVVPKFLDVSGLTGGDVAFSVAAQNAGLTDLFDILPMVGVGAEMGYLVVDGMVGNAAGSVARIPMTTLPSLQTPVPTGVAPLPSPNIKYAPDNGSPFTYSSARAVCDAGWVAYAGCSQLDEPVTATNQYGYPMGSCRRVCSGVTGNYYAWTSNKVGMTCPVGSTITGTVPNQTCTVNNPYQAYPDRKCDFNRAGSALSMISDPDCAVSGQVIPTICSLDGTSCSGTGVRFADSQPRNFRITTRPDGGSVVVANQQKTVSGQTQVQTTTVGISPSGVVDSVASNVSQGNIPASTTLAAADPVLNPTTPLVQSSNATDYARTGEAVAAANSLKPNLDKMALSLDSASFIDPAAVNPADAMQQRINDISIAPTVPTINWMPSLLPGTATVCHSMPIDGGVHGGLLNLSGSASFDICDKLDIVRQILGYFFMISTVVFIFRRFTRSNGEVA